ncbi:HAMP domain-containing protein [Azospirillum sp. 412522]|nr:HAMP domain-containing protein [Azospirillum sp. 412522]
MPDAVPASLAAKGPSVRFRLLAIALLPTAIVLPALLVFVAIWWSTQFDRLLTIKVNGDLTIARQYLDRLMESSGESLHALGDSAGFERMLAGGNDGEIAAFLESRRNGLSLDFLRLVTPQKPGAADAEWPVIRSALAGRAATAIDVLSGEQLARLAPDAAERARIELVPTPAAVPTDRTVETRGMIIQSATPVRLPDGRTGALVGGRLLNQNLDFIDTINDLVYKPATLPDGSQGTATLFLEDVRISTNVRLFAGKRALGTRVSAAVRRAVLDDGQVWRDSAFVVNDWYISAYEPIVDSHDRRVGMLYVGFLQAPFQAIKYAALVAVLAAFAVAALVTVPIFLRWVRGIFRPLEQMDRTIAAVEGGDLGARTGPVERSDEIGRVARHLDVLLDRLEERDRELRLWAEELDRRVSERTRELEATNIRLKQAQQRLVMSEKLAAIGEITAGIAHEINNPIAVIQGNLDIARETIGPAAEAVATEFRLIDQQVHRIMLLVNKLLQFAKPAEFAETAEPAVPAEVIADSLLLVRHLVNRASVAVVRGDHATGRVRMNRTDLQQVLINLFVNAIHAMPDGGTLSVRSADREIDGTPAVTIEVEDTGVGIPPEHKDRVFDAFFTTKPQHGTGLGLSISYTLVDRAGGTLTIDSTAGAGARFTILLPALLPA